MKFFLVIAIIATLFTACACTKKAEKLLPPATQTGANTFGCLINGVAYTATRKLPTGMGPVLSGGVTHLLSPGNLEIYALIDMPNAGSQKIWINILNFDGNLKRYTDITLNSSLPLSDFNSHVEINRYDNDAISGTFQVKVKRSDGIIWEVTKGRFDISR